MNGIGLQVVLFVVIFPLAVSAQDAKGRQFFWNFGSAITNTLPTCSDLAIKLIPADGGTNGTGPWYMNAYSLNGPTETQLLGNDSSSLRWKNNFPPDAELVLNVVDSDQARIRQGSSGGVPARTFKVAAGSTVNCIPAALSNPPKDFTVSSNLTSGAELETCGQFGLTIQGGVKPYKITILSTDSPFTTNVTMEDLFDAYTYINRAAPGTTLIGTVSDATARWAVGTAHVRTVGSTDTTCTGLDSTPGLASVLAQEASARSVADKKRRNALLAGILTPVLVLLFLGSIGGWWWFRRRARKNSGSAGSGGGFFSRKQVKRLASTDGLSKVEAGDPNQGWQMQPQLSPQRNDYHRDGQVLSINSYLDGGSSTVVQPQRSHTMASSHTMQTMESPTSTMSSPQFAGPPAGYATRSASLHSAGTVTSNVRPGFSSFPRQSVRNARGSAKSIEAGYSLDDEDNGAGPAPVSAAFPSSHAGPAPQWSNYPMPQNPESPLVSGGSPSASGNRRQLPVPGGTQPAGDSGVVFQHTDSGMPAVTELPPPYMPQR